MPVPVKDEVVPLVAAAPAVAEGAKQPRVPRGWLKQVRNTKDQHNTRVPLSPDAQVPAKEKCPPRAPKPQAKTQTKQNKTNAHTRTH